MFTEAFKSLIDAQSPIFLCKIAAVRASTGQQLGPIMRSITSVLRFALASVLLAHLSWVTPAWAQEQPAQVVFVCEHGSVKSLMATTLFDQAAEKRGLLVRSLSRGINPDSVVPVKIVDELKKEGVDVSQFKPQKLTPSDVSAAQQVIAIGVDLKTPAPEMIEQWTDIPPARVDYAAARAALIRHIDTLLVALQAEGVK